MLRGLRLRRRSVCRHRADVVTYRDYWADRKVMVSFVTGDETDCSTNDYADNIYYVGSRLWP